jgi:hypothetical protein
MDSVANPTIAHVHSVSLLFREPEGISTGHAEPAKALLADPLLSA